MKERTFLIYNITYNAVPNQNQEDIPSSVNIKQTIEPGLRQFKKDQPMMITSPLCMNFSTRLLFVKRTEFFWRFNPSSTIYPQSLMTLISTMVSKGGTKFMVNYKPTSSTQLLIRFLYLYYFSITIRGNSFIFSASFEATVF